MGGRLFGGLLEPDVDEGGKVPQQLPEAVFGYPEMRYQYHFLVFQQVHVDVGLQLHLKEQPVVLYAGAVHFDTVVLRLFRHLEIDVSQVLLGYALQLFGIGQ